MYIEDDERLDFEDVLIMPQPSEVSSRADVNLNVKVGDVLFDTPIVVANMDTTGTLEMAKALYDMGGTVALHKFYSNEQLQNMLLGSFYSMGTGDEDFKKLKEFGQPMMVCVDVANAYNEKSISRIKEIRKYLDGPILMAGNVATYDGAEALYDAGVDIVKVGIGPGSVCETRRVAGVGVPQLSAIMDCRDAADAYDKYICADGGIRSPGDAAKAIAAGADLVMIGGMFAGTNECEGEWEIVCNFNQTKDHSTCGEPHKKRLKFYGMSSKEAMEKYHGGVADYRASEGKCEWVNAKGPAENVLREILGGIRSACTYSNARNLTDFKENAILIKVRRTWR